MVLVYHGLPWYTMVHHGKPWYTMVSWYNMVHHSIPSYTMLHHSLLWYTTVYTVVPWYNIMVRQCHNTSQSYCCIPWHHGIPCGDTSRYTTDYHGLPWCTMVYHGVPSYSGIPWITMVIYGIPWCMVYTMVYQRTKNRNRQKYFCWVGMLFQTDIPVLFTYQLCLWMSVFN